jgi:phosphatidylcholine synthase
MKTPDNYFRGFPALWNVAAFYLLLLRPGPLAATAVVTALAAMTFVPFPFIHPLRVRRQRAINNAALAAWAVLAVAALAYDLMPPAWVTVALCLIAVYVVGAGYFRTRP